METNKQRGKKKLLKENRRNRNIQKKTTATLLTTRQGKILGEAKYSNQKHNKKILVVQKTDKDFYNG